VFIPFPPADVFNNSLTGCEEREKIKERKREKALKIETESLYGNTWDISRQFSLL
jgi:hypothetical protein